MFTWICPQCGREVPPSYSECPACAENRQRTAQGLPPVGAEPVAPRQPPPPSYQQGYPPTGPYQPQPAYPPQQPPQAAYPAQQQSPQPAYPPQQPQPQPQYAPPPPPPPQWQTSSVPPQPTYTLPDTVQRRGMPTWLVTILVAGIAIAVIFGVVKLFSGKAPSGPDSATTAAQQAVATSDSSNPYAKFLEVTGVRIVEDEKKHPNAMFLVVNHSSADLPEFQLEVALTTNTAKAGDEPLAVMTVKTGTIPANGSKDISVPLNTKLRAYELPDWQFLKASFVIKSPR
jgi:hypothetical protein